MTIKEFDLIIASMGYGIMAAQLILEFGDGDDALIHRLLSRANDELEDVLEGKKSPQSWHDEMAEEYNVVVSDLKIPPY